MDSVGRGKAVAASAESPTGARRRGRPGYDQDTIVKVAVDVFTDKGFDGTSMEDLARQLHITKSAIYYHVDSKNHLLELALNPALDGLAGVIDNTRGMDAPAVERLDALVRGSVRVLVAERPSVTLLLRVRGNSDVERRALERRRSFDRYVEGLVKQAIGEGAVRPDIRPAVTARLLFGLVNSLVEWVRPRTDRDVEALVNAVCAVAFRGILV